LCFTVHGSAGIWGALAVALLKRNGGIVVLVTDVDGTHGNWTTEGWMVCYYIVYRTRLPEATFKVGCGDTEHSTNQQTIDKLACDWSEKGCSLSAFSATGP